MGVMDRTHLRWFTPRTYKTLFESCGYVVDSVGELAPLTRKARTISFLTFGCLRHLFIEQVSVKGHCSYAAIQMGTKDTQQRDD